MYSETFFTQCSFDPNGLILCGQTVRSIAWGTVESGSSDALADVINALSEGPPTFYIPADTIPEILDAGSYLLAATTSQQAEKQILKPEIFCGESLTPISG